MLLFLLFLLLVTFIDYFLLGQEGQGLYSLHCGTWGKGCTLIFSLHFFDYLGGGRGLEVDVLFSPSLKIWNEEGEKG